ncbi:MAG: hypothetical protein ABI867_12800 [Kofleriaceae bacterium]
MIAFALVLGCSGGAREQARREAQAFLCKDRIASYTAAHHMAGDEIGVQMDCKEAGPRVKRWRTDRAGKHEEDQHPITPNDFDTAWNQIQGAGWENMPDCPNGSGGKQDPLYVFDIKDDQNQKTFQCQSQTMPYPYNTIVDPLDSVAQKNRGQLGDDEPADLKALDKKKPK